MDVSERLSDFDKEVSRCSLKLRAMCLSPGIHCRYMSVTGWFSKLGPLFGVPNIVRHLLFRVSKKGP